MDEFNFWFYEDRDEFESINEIANLIWNTDWEQVFQHNKFKTFKNDGSIESLTKDEKISFAQATLLAFVQQNFTGPDLKEAVMCLVNSGAEEELSVNGVLLDPNIKCSGLLLLTKKLLEDLLENDKEDLLVNIWYLRYLITHQKVLEEKVSSIYENVSAVSKLLIESLTQIPSLRSRFLINLEVIHASEMYRKAYKVKTMLENLKSTYQIETIVEGMLGMRTKWQQKALPQLLLMIKQTNDQLSLLPSETHKSTKLTGLLQLDDEVRLEKIKFIENEHNESQQVDSALQNLILLVVTYLEISQPKDELATEELRPYISLLLNQEHGPWAIRLCSLSCNIKYESTHRRTVERSLKQCEELVTSIDSNNVPVRQRLSYIFSSNMILRHEIRSQLADLMLSLGLIKSALEIYLGLQQWEDVILCYTALQLRQKSAEIIRQELEKKPSVKLYCLLGDATDDINCYEQAWEFSKQTSGRALRHWGNFYFARKEYETAIPLLQKSLTINAMQEVSWLRLGFAALSLDKWELAASAYVRYTQLEPSGFESWNNLAKCCIKLGDKKRAHKILQEALKCNYNNWRVWENFLLVSIDIGSFEDSINAYERLIEMKEKYFDEEILKILANAVLNDVRDTEGFSAKRLKKKTMELLAHLGAMLPNEGIVWELSSKLTDEPLVKAQKLQKAYKGYSSTLQSWQKNEKMVLDMLELVRKLCESSLAATTSFEDKDKMLVLSQLTSARLTGNSCLKLATNEEDWDSCKGLVADTTNLVEQITDQIKMLK